MKWNYADDGKLSRSQALNLAMSSPDSTFKQRPPIPRSQTESARLIHAKGTGVEKITEILECQIDTFYTVEFSLTFEVTQCLGISPPRGGVRTSQQTMSSDDLNKCKSIIQVSVTCITAT